MDTMLLNKRVIYVLIITDSPVVQSGAGLLQGGAHL